MTEPMMDREPKPEDDPDKLAELASAIDAAWDTIQDAFNAYAMAGGGGYSAVMLKGDEPADLLKRIPKRSALRSRLEMAQMKIESRAKGYGVKTLNITVSFDDENDDGFATPYPATERDEDSEYEYAREDAPLLQEDRR